MRNAGRKGFIQVIPKSQSVQEIPFSSVWKRPMPDHSTLSPVLLRRKLTALVVQISGRNYGFGKIEIRQLCGTVVSALISK
jgi:hypothetical protein